MFFRCLPIVYTLDKQDSPTVQTRRPGTFDPLLPSVPSDLRGPFPETHFWTTVKKREVLSHQ